MATNGDPPEKDVKVKRKQEKLKMSCYVLYVDKLTRTCQGAKKMAATYGWFKLTQTGCVNQQRSVFCFVVVNLFIFTVLKIFAYKLCGAEGAFK